MKKRHSFHRRLFAGFLLASLLPLLLCSAMLLQIFRPMPKHAWTDEDETNTSSAAVSA